MILGVKKYAVSKGRVLRSFVAAILTLSLVSPLTNFALLNQASAAAQNPSPVCDGTNCTIT